MAGDGKRGQGGDDAQGDEVGGEWRLSVTSPRGPRCRSLGIFPLRRRAATSVSPDDDMMDYLCHCQPSQNQSATDKVHQPPTLNLRLCFSY